MPADVLSKAYGPTPIVRRMLPGLCKPPLEVSVRTAGHQREKDKKFRWIIPRRSEEPLVRTVENGNGRIFAPGVIVASPTSKRGCNHRACAQSHKFAPPDLPKAVGSTPPHRWP